ncbi:hypothetical protein JYK14_16570 [Siccirubricoccus sp. KC 17139]|uniref:DUF922 domain-containing protein n=1 Tax=Siccirubricoccus soli TaxID=2899147 RepID=A0ABT1D742_9PROT|nr:hypothetical protein [Siccirubricoccus soli]MCO6417763.1 hypothetical protein [Siccirubricoccus soli]MCP2683898.1 hypothetical protein [Siccirubricoccus soli]
MAIRRAVLLALLGLVLGPGTALAQLCPRVTPRLTLAVVDPEPVLGHELDIAALHAESGQQQRETLRHLGLTTSRVEWQSEIETRYREGAGQVCVVPARIALTLVQTEHLVRIARELPEGGCLYREVLAHERRHVAVNRRSLRVAAEKARGAATAWAARAEGRGQTLEEAMDALQQGLRRALEPSLAAMRRAREAEHRRIDTEAEYQRLARICPGDQQRLREELRVAG